MRRSKNRQLEAGSALLFLLPNVMGFAVFTLFPILASLVLAFFHWSPLQGMSHFADSAQFAGVSNFWRALGFHQHADLSWHANDALFWKYLGNTVILLNFIRYSTRRSRFR